MLYASCFMFHAFFLHFRQKAIRLPPMLVIRLSRTGKINEAAYRIVVAEKASAVKSKCIDSIGFYVPSRNPKQLKCDKEKFADWVRKGARPSNTLARLLKKDGYEGLEKFIVSYTKKTKAKPEGESAKATVQTAVTPAT